MAVELAEAAEAAGAYRSWIPQLIRTAVNHIIFHAFWVKLGTCSWLLCGGHTVPDFSNINRWHLPLNNESGQACANSDELGAWKILQRREEEEAKKSLYFCNSRLVNTKSWWAHLPPSVTLYPGRACMKAVKKLWWGRMPQHLGKCGLHRLGGVGSDQEARSVTGKLASCRV